MKRKALQMFLMLCIGTGLLPAQNLAGSDYGETETYRRSSLCLILLTHKGTQYAEQMAQQFLQIPLPERYNEHNLTIRVLSASGKQNKNDIDYKLYSNDIAKDLVKKWFNYNSYTRTMNMDLIHQRGGYNASYEDLLRAENTERGVALLSEEGDELLQNTFVLVCDMDYYDKAQTGQILAGILAASSYMLDAYAQEQYRKGDTNAATYSELGSTLAMGGAAVAADMGGFAVNMKAYLYRLKWNDELKDKMYSKFWIDESYPISERINRQNDFESDKSSFGLEYIGMYRERSERTVFKSQNDLNKVIREVCATTINKGIENLAKNYPIFKPKTSFYCDGSNLYAYIGTKEGVKSSSKYEILETQKKKGEITYKRVGMATPTSVWNNSNIDFSNDTDYSQYKGTEFALSKGRIDDVCGMGLQMREMGKAGYQYKKHNFKVSAGWNMVSISDKDLRNYLGETTQKYCREIRMDNDICYTFNLGWNVNYGTHFAWNVLDWRMCFGGLTGMGANTGCILRTRPLGTNGKWAFFIWPSIGVKFFDSHFSYYRFYSYTSRNNGWQDRHYFYSGIDYDIKMGVNITPWMFLAYKYGKHSNGVSLGFNF